MPNDSSRAFRDNGGEDNKNNKTAWWKAGHIIEDDDHEISRFNLGLGRRERVAIAEENSYPCGHRFWPQSVITGRARRATGEDGE